MNERSLINELLGHFSLLPPIYICAEILESGISHQRDYSRLWPELLSYLHCGDDVCSGRGAGEKSFFPRDSSCHVLSVICLHRNDLVNYGRVPQRWAVADADSFDFVRPGLATR